MMMQALVIAHACYGHNSFLKVIIYFEPGRMPRQLLIIWCLRRIIFLNVKKNTAWRLWRLF